MIILTCVCMRLDATLSETALKYAYILANIYDTMYATAVQTEQRTVTATVYLFLSPFSGRREVCCE